MKWFFNVNFKSAPHNKPYVRVGMEMDENGTLFGSMSESATGSRRFSYMEYDRSQHVDGVSYPAIDLDKFLAFVPKLTSEEIGKFRACFEDISRSFRYHVGQSSSMHKGLPSEVQTAVYAEIIRVRGLFEDILNGKVAAPAAEEWQVLCTEDDFGDMRASTKYTEIVDKTLENFGKEVEIGGDLYKVTATEKDEYVIMVKRGGKPATSPEKPVEAGETVAPTKTIPTRPMALCVDAKGISNFNEGELYDVLGRDGDFLKVCDIFNVPRMMFAKRFVEVAVEEELAVGE